MGYSKHPTMYDKPIDDLTDEEAMDETIVQVLFDAHYMTSDPHADKQDRVFAQMVIHVINHYAGDDMPKYLNAMKELSFANIRNAAEEKGMTVEQFLKSMGAPDEIIQFLDRKYDA